MTTLGKAHNIADITLETALELLAAKAAKAEQRQKKASTKKKVARKRKNIKKSGAEAESRLDASLQRQ